MSAAIPTEDDLRRIVREELERALGGRREWLSTAEAADRAGVSAKTVRAWIASGALASHHAWSAPCSRTGTGGTST